MQKRGAALAFIFVTVLLDVLAVGIIIPVLPRLIQDFMGGEASRAAVVYGLFGTVFALMQFLFAPVLGALSDRHGRRPVILLSCLGLGLDYALMALSPTLAWLFVGRIVSGITASNFATAGAYIADVTPPEKRAASFGTVSAAWGLGFVLGPALGGVLGGVSPRLPFWVAAALALLNALYGLFVLPESLPPERRRPFAWRRANPLGALALLRSHRELLGLAGVNGLYWLAHQVLPSVFVLYAGYRYGWGPRAVGLTLALVGVCSIAVQAGVVRPAVKRLGERGALMTGLACGAAAFAVYGLARTGGLFLCGVIPGSLLGLFGPSIQSLMSRRVGMTEQGELQGANASVMGLAGLVGPGLFTFTFSRSIAPGAGEELPGAPFLLAAALVVAAAFLAARVTRRATRERQAAGAAPRS